MLNKNLIFIVIVLFIVSPSFAAQNSPNLPTGKIMELNTQYNFVVINLGENDGLKPGVFLKVLRQNQEIAKLTVIKVRKAISAAEIKELKKGEQIKVDDLVVFLKEEKPKELKSAKPEVKKENVAKPAPKEKPAPVNQLAKGAGANIKTEGDKNIVEADINAQPELVFDATNILLRDRGFIVSAANREAGFLVATKELLLSRWEEFWASFSGAIDHELLFSIQIKEKTNVTHMEISVRAGCLIKDKYRKIDIKDNSYEYKEAVDLISEVKSWTQGLGNVSASSAEKKAPKDL